MTTRRRRPTEPLKPSESYYAAAQLYTQEFRTVGERTNAFFIAQSIFFTAFFLTLASQKLFPFAFTYVVSGIIVIGVLFCVLHLLAGRAGSRAAFRWRQYMTHHIENNHADTPWNWFYIDCKHTPQGEIHKKLWHRLKCERCLLERPPLPSAWLFSPAIFLMVWSVASLYTPIKLSMEGDPLRSNLLFPLPLSMSIIVALFALGALGFVIWHLIVWWCYPNN